jgi:uncharacterized membrane protein YkvA (DUF1232 family)
MWRLGATTGRLPRYLALAREVYADPAVVGARKAVLGAALAYTKADLVPEVIPVAGQLDDLAVLLLALRQALAGLPEDAATRYLEDAALSAALLDEDIEVVQGATGWLLGRAASVGMRGLAGSLRALAGAARRRPEP